MTKTAVPRTHPAVRRFRDARDGRDPRSLFVEGPRLVAELLKSDLRVREFLYTPAAMERPEARGLADALRGRNAAGLAVLPDVMAFASDVIAPPGLIARADRPFPLPLSPDGPFWKEKTPLLVVLEGLQSPANVGAVLRGVEAAGASGVLTTPGTADPWGPKALRASAGSVFRVPSAPVPSLKSLADLLTAHHVTLVAADAKTGTPHTQWDWTRPTALLLGTEGRGLPDLAGLNVEHVRIPMAGQAESLNVAVASGVLLFEAARQRSSRS